MFTGMTGVLKFIRYFVHTINTHESIMVLLFVVLSLLAMASARPPPPPLQHQRRVETETRPDYYSQLRQHLLDGYDRFSYPFNYVQEYDEEEEVTIGLPVEVGINFHKVRKIDVVEASADLNVWFREYWYDSRLTWNPSEWGNITSMTFWVGDGSGSMGETSEIWTPRLYLWNAQEPIGDTLDNAAAIVTPEGRVAWSRPGHINAACKFEGLQGFPFDELSCKLEFGTWAYTGKYVYPIPDSSGGYSLGGSETAGQSFAEFALSRVSAYSHVYPPYPTAPDESWPVIFYELHFTRSWEPYARGYLVFAVLMNLMAFCCLWVPPATGERLGLGITAMLASIAGELVISDRVPPSADWTWYATFSVVSVAYNSSVVFQSTLIVYLHYHAGKSLVPSWLCRLCSKDGEEDEIVFEKAAKAFGGVEETAKVSSEGSSSGSNSMETTAKWQKVTKRVSDRRKSEVAYASSVKDAEDFKSKEEMKNNAKWQKLAKKIDSVCRVVLPATYAVVLTAFLAAAG